MKSGDHSNSHFDEEIAPVAPAVCGISIGYDQKAEHFSKPCCVTLSPELAPVAWIDSSTGVYPPVPLQKHLSLIVSARSPGGRPYTGASPFQQLRQLSRCWLQSFAPHRA